MINSIYIKPTDDDDDENKNGAVIYISNRLQKSDIPVVHEMQP